MDSLLLFLIFLKIGVFGFGGGIAMLPLIFKNLHDFGIMTAEEFSNLVAISQITPGPIAINAATYAGYHSAGFLGAILTTLGIVIPSFVIIIVVMKFMDVYKENLVLQGGLEGIRPATIGLIAGAVVIIGKTFLITDEGIDPIPLVMVVISAGISLTGKVHPFLVICIMGAAGGVLCG